MSTAIYVHEAYKKFGAPLPAFFGRRPRLVNNTVPPMAVALDRVSFSVEEGEIFGVAGRDGSGKSTLVRVLAALLPLDGGEARVFGYDVRRQPALVQRQSNRGLVDASFFRQLSPLENLLHGMGRRGAGREQACDEVVETLLDLGLAERQIYLPIETAPRSVQQKVVLARALLARPRLLLLDEPFAGLDEADRWLVQCALSELRQRHGTTILCTARQASEITGLCDRVALLEQGRLAGIDAPQQAPLRSGLASEALACAQLGQTRVYLEPDR